LNLFQYQILLQDDLIFLLNYSSVLTFPLLFTHPMGDFSKNFCASHLGHLKSVTVIWCLPL
jgi:hypothetical protein